MRIRQKPENGDWYEWTAFDRWADANGIGCGKRDWWLWWECWRAAYIAAMNA